MYLKNFYQEQLTGTQNVIKKKGSVKSKEYIKKNSKEDLERTKEEKIESILGRARSRYVVELINKGDEMTTEDKEIVAQTQEHIMEEQRAAVESHEVDNFVGSLSKCYLSGCVVHTLTPDFVHYCNGISGCYQPISKMSRRMKKGLDVYLKNPTCLYVEVYERHICVVANNGTTNVISE